MIRFNLSSPVEDVSHIARGVAAQLKHLEVRTVEDLLFYFPARYDDLSKITSMRDARVGERVVLLGKVELIETQRSRYRKKLITSAVVSDATGSVRAIWFAQPWISKIFKGGDEVYLVGELKDDGSGAYLSSPVYEKVSRNEATHVARIVPVYPSTEKLSQKQIRFLMRNALPMARAILDPLPEDLRVRYQLAPLPHALAQIHFPINEVQLESARRRLKFDELLRLQLFAAYLKRELKKVPAPSITFREDKTKQFVESLPFKLTEAQRKAAWEIIGDIGKARPMNRLLEGDVGSGKTVVVAVAALNCVLGACPSPGLRPPSPTRGEGVKTNPPPLVGGVRGGGQVAIMAPTEILARQHFMTFGKLFASRGVRVGLLTQGAIRSSEAGIMNPRTRASSVRGRQELGKVKMMKKIREGGVDVVVGTQALIQDTAQFKNLVLAVVDEQHRFGVSQRAKLREKRTDGMMPHLLSLTATPIPRSLALVFYGDLDISILDEMPKGRQKIETRIVVDRPSPAPTAVGAPSPTRGEGVKTNPPPLVGGVRGGGQGEGSIWSRAHAYDFVRKEVQAGHQAFWTCPIIDPSDTLGVKAATEVFEHLRTAIFSDLRIGLLHGRMKSKERECVMEEFAGISGSSASDAPEAELHHIPKIDILVATPVIEVGIDVPNATVMVIEGAQRFGLAQLHQFRGRVGRGEAKSYCLLMVDNSGLSPATGLSPTQARLKAFLECDNGFELAERDLALRGPGEIYGTTQSGFPEFKIASFADMEIAKEAKEAAETLLAQDPELSKYPELKQAILAREGKAHLE